MSSFFHHLGHTREWRPMGATFRGGAWLLVEAGES